MTAKKKMYLAVAAALQATGLASIASATSIYTETWSGGTIPSAYTVAHSTAADGASIVGANNVLTTTSGSSGVTLGNVQISTNTTGAGSLYDPSFNSQLDSNGNSNLLTWTLNMQESRSNPSGFGSNNSGVAYILSASDPNFLSTGEGYALTIGSTGADPVCLIHYTSGLAAVGLNAVNSPFNMLKTALNASQHYTSVRLTYAPGTDTWKMYVRDDGTTGFTDAINTPVPDGSLIGSVVQAASSAAAGYSGFVQTHTTTANDLGQFDNISLNIGPAPVLTPRNLQWDADATGAATDGSGSWATTNAWIDQADGVTHANWDSSRPDNAIIGAGSGAGVATVDLAGGQVVGQITFNANSPTYTLTNGTLTVDGWDDDNNPATALQAMVVQQSTTLNSPMNWVNDAVMHVNGSGTVLTLNGGLAGTGLIDKFGTGTVLLPTVPAARSGDMTIETGMVHVTGFTGGAGGVSALGSGQTNIKSAATLWLDAGTSTVTMTSAAGILYLGDQSTLRVTGNITYQKNFPTFATGTDPTSPKNATIHVDSNSTLLWRAQLHNDSSPVQNYFLLHLDGPGAMKITNSGTDGGGSQALNVYSGDWDLSNGQLILGQNSETGGSSGDTLNALGDKNATPADGSTITIRGTGTLIGTENISNTDPDNIKFYRGKVIMSGGTLASGNGKDTNWAGNFTTTTGTTSTIATYDPLNPSVPRTTSLVRGPHDTSAVQAETVWNGNLVIDPGTTTGGAFNVNRDLITSSETANPTGVSVTPGATITVNQGAILNISSAFTGAPLNYSPADALTDGTNSVNVVNNSNATWTVGAIANAPTNSGFNVFNGDKHVGAVDGTGNMTVDSTATLTANRIRQNTATLNGNTTIRPNSTAAGVSNIRNLVINTGVRLDLTNNKLVTGNPAGTWNGTNYTDTAGQVASGKGPSNNWDGTTGIVTSQSTAVGSNFTSIGVARASDVLPATATATALWAGQTITGTDTLVMYTYGGDATLDGKINVDDYIKIDSGIAAHLTGWSNGDFNYDGKVNIDDYTGFIDANIGTQGPQFPTAGAADVSGGASGVTAVPEPASLALIGLGATALLSRRRRRQA